MAISQQVITPRKAIPPKRAVLASATVASDSLTGVFSPAPPEQEVLRACQLLMAPGAVHELELFAEAVENGYVFKNPARRIMLPACRNIQETEALSEQQVRLILEKTEGRDRLMWRVLLLTGLRIGELLALRKADLIPAGLCIDESSRGGKPSTTKNKKTRVCASSSLAESGAGRVGSQCSRGITVSECSGHDVFPRQ
jgi:integrase